VNLKNVFIVSAAIAFGVVTGLAAVGGVWLLVG